MRPTAGAPGNPGRLVIHASASEIGGAEASLLAEVAGECAGSGLVPFFLVPAEGPLAREARARGWAARVVAWPRGMGWLSQNRWYSLPLVLPGLVPYLFRLGAEFMGAQAVRSSGFKSHCACALLAPWLRSRLLFDIRDFLKPHAARKFLAVAAARFGCRISANSRSVAADFPGARVRYPPVALKRPPVDRRPVGGRIVISHLAYFAPYKGQDLFLVCARKLLDAGVDAEFRLIGDVIYPAGMHHRYRDRIMEMAVRLRLSDHVRFLGKVEGPEKVQRLLEETHLLLHCTREPEPFGRAVMEGLLCGSEAVCHKGSGVCEVAETGADFSGWMQPIGDVLGPDYVRVRLKRSEVR